MGPLTFSTQNFPSTKGATMTPKISSSLLACAAALLSSCASSPTKSAETHPGFPVLWSLCDHCAQPESAYVDEADGFIFLSNVDGNATDKDGKGRIQKVGLDGKMINATWVEGLDAPKGLRAEKGTLFVTNIDEIVAIDIKSGKITKRAKAKGAKFLNDLTVRNGIVYATDTFGTQIYTWNQKSAPKVFLAGPELQAPNGILIEGDSLIVAAWGIPQPDFSTKVPGRLLKVDLKTKKITAITEKPLGNLDGLERRANGNYLVSDWMAGKVYEVTPTGTTTLLMSGFKGSADLGWRESTATLILPRMGENQITAYKLN
jgi:hypothetical protein